MYVCILHTPDPIHNVLCLIVHIYECCTWRLDIDRFRFLFPFMMPSLYPPARLKNHLLYQYAHNNIDIDTDTAACIHYSYLIGEGGGVIGAILARWPPIQSMTSIRRQASGTGGATPTGWHSPKWGLGDI